MNPHMLYSRSGPAGYPARFPLFWGFGAPLVGGLLGGFLGSAIFNYPRPYAYPPPYRDLTAARLITATGSSWGFSVRRCSGRSSIQRSRTGLLINKPIVAGV